MFMSVRFGEEKYLEIMMKIFEKVEKFSFKKYRSFMPLLKMFLLHKHFS